MSPRYEFQVVGTEEDSGLRAVLRQTAMPGKISVSLQREPSFFAAERAGNLETQVIAARDTDSGMIVGLGSRSFRRMFVDGEARGCGYLSGLRLLPEVRCGTVLARGYSFLKALHGDGRAPFYITTILNDNRHATRLLTSRRAGLPVYEPFGRLTVHLLPLYARTKSNQRSSEVVRGVRGDVLNATVDAVNAFNRRHQFGPQYTADDLEGRTPLLPHFNPDALYACMAGSQVTATLGVWDQAALKQWVVSHYSRPYRLAAQFSNVGALLGLTPRLPGVGKPISLLYASFLSYAPGRADSFGTLLTAVLGDWSRRGYAYLAVGATEGSPLCGILQTLSKMRLSSTIYLVYWPDLLSCPLPSQSLAPHLEIATL